MNRKQESGTVFSMVLRQLKGQIATFILLAALSAGGIIVTHSALIENAKDTGSALVESYAAGTQSDLEVYETLLSFGAESINSGVMDQASDDGLVKWMSLYFRQLSDVLGEGAVSPYMVLDGKVYARDFMREEGSFDIHRAVWYQKAMEENGKLVYTDVYTDTVTNKPVVTLAVKSDYKDAVLAFDIYLDQFHVAADSFELPFGGSFFLCDGNGVLVGQRTDSDRNEGEIQEYVKKLKEQVESGRLEGINNSIIDMNGMKRAVYYTYLDNGWLSVITVPYNQIHRNYSWLIVSFVLILLTFLLAAIAVCWKDVRYHLKMRRINDTVQVLGNSYYALYRVDYGQNTYEMIKGSKYVRDRLAQTGKYDDLLYVMGEVLEEAVYQDFMDSFSVENMRNLVTERVRNFGGEFLRRFDDQYHWVRVEMLFDESLAPEEVVLCFRMVDDEKQLQLQERKLLEDALEVSKKNEAAKQTFYRNMSHDMRTPLNAIIGLSQLAVRYLDQPKQIEGYLNQIRASSRQLLRLINDLLDMSRMEQGKVVLNNQKINLKECINTCLDSFRYEANTEGKRLITKMSILDPMIMGDAFRISQILNNMLSNAFKFTAEGDRISVSVTQLDRGDIAKYRIVISDTGIGMSDSFLQKLFEPYSREMRFAAKRVTGTGLGMSIVKNLVSQMDGEITVESEINKGTTFTVILPFAIVGEGDERKIAETQESNTENAEFLQGRKILLAEDNEINMEITTELLTMYGAKVLQAWNGQEAVDLFSQEEPFSIDAVLMDMQMPVMDGCQAARTIRGLDRMDAEIVPIIAVTANAFAEDVAATTAAGMNAHVSKPIDFRVFCQILKRLTEEFDAEERMESTAGSRD